MLHDLPPECKNVWVDLEELAEEAGLLAVSFEAGVADPSSPALDVDQEPPSR